MADPQTLTQVIGPYIPLLTPATILAIAWKAARLITQIEDRAESSEQQLKEVHKAVTNELVHSNEAIRDEVRGLREDMKLMFQTRIAIDSAAHKAE